MVRALPGGGAWGRAGGTGELTGRLKAVKVNVEEAPRVAERFGVQGIPTLLILRQGREVARQVGAVPPPTLLRWVEEVIAKPAA